MNTFGASTFPQRGVLPKTETGALSFLADNPEYDGRGTIVAILDTGCDPGANGLQITSENKPKFVDVIDSTGSGDVNTSKQIKISSLHKDILTSPLSNNKLLLNESWIKQNKNGYFNLGLVRAYDFFPKPLIKRLEKKRTEKFNNKLSQSLESLRNEVSNKTKKLQNAPKDMSKENKKKLKEEIEDLNTLIDILAKETNSGSGPVFDVIVWNDGKQYNAVLNTISMDSYVNCTDLDEIITASTEYEAKSFEADEDQDDESIVFVKKDGNGGHIYDVSGLSVLTNYRISQQYGTISKETMLNYVTNIYDSGNLVSIVVPGGSHGTHVAGIVGGYYKDDPSLNGVAPGCQLVSIKIGDTRLSTMETNQGLMRALYHIKQNKCDLVNMSYGEPTTALKTGCFPKGVESLVWKYGTIFISSAGNDGPCLSTAGAPQSGTDAIIGIGAMFSPQMIQSEYGLVQKGDDGETMANYYEAYSWSSRGPTLDGAIGVKVMSPGGAIAPIPSYTLSRNQLMNGTSMSSPNACGNVALLVSALKQKQLKYTPYGIELALINSATNSVLNKIDAVARGYGLLQVARAFEYCVKHPHAVNSVITNFDVSINGKNHNNARGIYIRETSPSATSYNVAITPKFHQDTDNSIKVKYQIKCELRTEENWIKPAPFTLIAANGRYFEIRVDPLKLFRQNANEYIPVFRGYVLGMNADDLSAGPLFRIPVTVCNHIKYPLRALRHMHYDEETSYASQKELQNNPYLYTRRDKFRVGKISRVFHHVPSGASAVRFRMKCIKSKDDKQMRFAFATLYAKGSEQIKFNRWVRVQTGDEMAVSLQRVEPNTILETSLCQYSLSFGECLMQWSIEFVGPQIVCDENAIAMNTGDEYGVITLRTDAISCMDVLDQINPAVKFDTFVAYYAAKYGTIRTNTLEEVGDIDIDTGDKVYTLDLEYEFDQCVAGSKNIIKFSVLDNLLYESLYLGNFWQLFDANKQLIASGEAFEESSKIAKQKGYLLILQLRSANMKLLEKAKTSTVLRIDTVLATKQQISADLYSSKLGILSASGKISSAESMTAYANRDLFVSLPTTASIVKILDVRDVRNAIKCGSQLLGYCKLNKDAKECLRPKFRDNGQRGSCSLCVPLVLNINNPNSKTAESRSKLPEINGDNDEKNGKKEDKEMSLEERQRDAMIDWIAKKLKSDVEEQKKAFAMLEKQEIFTQKDANHHLALLLLKLDIYRSAGDMNESMLIADEILNEVDLKEIGAFFGKKVVDKNDSVYKKLNKKYKEQKNAVIDALKAKLSAIKKQYAPKDKKGKKSKQNVIDDFVAISADELAAFEDVYKQLSEWIDCEKDKKMFDQNLWLNLQKGLNGKVLNLVNDKIISTAKDEKAVQKDQIELKLKIYKKCCTQRYNGFNFLVDQIRLDSFKKYPKHYRSF